MNEKRVKEILAGAGAVITDSHLVYTSGKHGSEYVNKDAVYPFAEKVDELCEGIATMFIDDNIEIVVAPAIGAIDLKTGVARHLASLYGRKVLGVYAEHEEEVIVPKLAEPETYICRQVYVDKPRTFDVAMLDGHELVIKKPSFVIKRGYDKLVAGKRVLVVEDILTTGGSARETVHAARRAGGKVLAVAAMVNRGGVTHEALGGVKVLRVLLNVAMKAYPPQECPLCASGVPINTDVGHGRQFLANQAKT